MAYSNWSTKFLASFVTSFRHNLMPRPRPVFISYMILILKAHNRLLYEEYFFDLLNFKHFSDQFHRVRAHESDFYCLQDRN